jgi:urea transport system permease protein
MTNRFAIVCALIVLSLLQFANPLAAAEGADTLQSSLLKLADQNATVRSDVLLTLAKTGNAKLEPVFESYRLGSLYVWDDNGTARIILCEEIKEDEDFNEIAPLSDPLTREPIVGTDGKQLEILLEDLEEISPNRDERKLASQAKFFLRLFSPDAKMRLSGAKKCGDPPYNVDALELLKEIANNDADKKTRYFARESQLLIRFSGKVPEQTPSNRNEAVRQLGKIKSLRALPRLESLLDELNAEENPDAQLQQACRESIGIIQSHQKKVDRYSNIFRGLSLGSVLILMALGLAITFGLMGVINMAHGELMMIGAYTTFEIQRLFNHTPDAPQNHYYFWALPAAFLAAALVGLIMEVVVVRHLYRRPLESLLATWGIGLVLIQIARIRYGDNIGVNAPEWARGSLEVMQDVNLPYARIFILGLCLLAVLVVWWQMNHTRIGLHIRATMQSRDMAKSLGVNTRWVDRYTFAFGAGLAGVAGCAWTLIGGITPDMGQTNFIVDSFLVVVVGGVGELLGVVFSGLGIGVVTKWIEPFTGTIWAKILLLVAVVIFIQFKPAGLFAPKGRLADD